MAGREDEETKDMVTTEQAVRDRKILDFNPWGDDDSDYKVLANTMVVARVVSQCNICFGPIQPGQRVRAQREVCDGKMMTFRFCVECCDAMVRRFDADDEEDEMEIENRYEIGRQRAESR